jgi:hypothetical protein
MGFMSQRYYWRSWVDEALRVAEWPGRLFMFIVLVGRGKRLHLQAALVAGSLICHRGPAADQLLEDGP